MPDHNAFRPVVLVFSVLAFFQFATGAVLYGLKIGFHPASTYEYYRGSETMRAHFPERPDRFVEPRTFSGLAKSAVGHSIGYALICFLITHLLRSLTAGTSAFRRADRLSVFFFLAAFLDILAGFVVLYGPPFTAWIRTGCFVLFETAGMTCTLWMIRFSIAGKPATAGIVSAAGVQNSAAKEPIPAQGGTSASPA